MVEQFKNFTEINISFIRKKIIYNSQCYNYDYDYDWDGDEYDSMA